MVASASGFAKLTGAGPLSSLHETPSVDPTGRPSSEAAPARLAAAGNVIVWALPAPTVGAVLVGVTVNRDPSEACCSPVLTVTVRAPTGAPCAAICATALVALFTETGPNAPSAAPPTEIPGPKVATVIPCTEVRVLTSDGDRQRARRDHVRGRNRNDQAGGNTVRGAVLLLVNVVPVVVRPATATRYAVGADTTIVVGTMN